MEKEEKAVDIGLINDCEPWRLHSKFFPSKVGGKPAWLNRKPPQPSKMQCGYCKEPLIFLCQVYAPINDNNEAFHRTVFIFVCKNGSCYKPNKSENIKVFRNQLKRDNEFYSFDPPVEEEDFTFDDSKGIKLCYICGSRGPSHCAKCKKINYCSRSHQIYHWKNGHKENCNEEVNENSSNFKNNMIFPEFELVIEEEPEESCEKKTSEEQELQYLNKLIEEKKAGCLSEASETELEQYANKSVEDKTFSKFKKRVDREPEQVLRYERGGKPLWISSEITLAEEEIPNCQYCGGKRQFEFQIMPQLLNFLDIEFNINSIDWGIIAIYTCANHCCDDNEPYKSEFAFKQDVNSTSSNLIPNTADEVEEENQ